MKILMLHDPYAQIQNGVIGGEDNLAELQVNILRDLGHEVYDARFIDSGVIRIKNQLLAQGMGKTQGIEKIISSFKPDVIHTLNLNQRSGYQWMYETSVPIVSTIHNFRLFCPASIAWREGKICTKCLDSSAINAIRFRCAGKIGTINSIRHLVFQRDYPQLTLPKLFLLASEKMKSIFYSVIPEYKIRVLPTPQLPHNLISDSEVKRQGWLFSGRFTREKGIIELILSWPENEKLHIAGNGPLKKEILNLIQNRPNIKLIGTYPPGDHSIYLKYEGLIFPSTWLEGSPLVVMECLGTGTPVICTEISSASEQVRAVKGGIVINQRLSEITILEAIQKVRLNFDYFSKNALSKSKEHFSLESWGTKFEKNLKEVINL